jgi:hypothetical protein
MSTVTLRLPDDTAARLKQIAKAPGVGMNKLMEELGTAAVAAPDTAIHFRTLAASANPKRALSVLDRLDELDRTRP